MSVLEWMLVCEGVLLAAAGVFWVAGLAIAAGNPDDPVARFYQTFWRVFFRRRGKLRAAVTSLDVEKAKQYEEMKQTGDVEGIRSLLENEFGGNAFAESEISEALDESIAARPSDSIAAEPGERAEAALLSVTVIPFAAQNEFISMRSDGATIQVTCGPEEGQANKAVIDLVADALKIKPYQVTLLKGHYKAFKTLSIAGMDQADLDLKLSN